MRANDRPRMPQRAATNTASPCFWWRSTLEPVSEVEFLRTVAAAKIEGISREEYLHAAATGESRPSLVAPPNP